MKKISIFLFLAVISLNGFSQVENQAGTQAESSAVSFTLPKFYLGLQSGLESFTGLIGITADYRVADNFFVRAGAGIGSWGSKISAGFRYEKKYEKSVGFGLSISRASGLKNFITQMETTSGTKDVKLDLLEGYTVNPTISYKWVIKKGHRFFVEGGYAVPLQESPWRVKDGSVLTENSKIAMQMLRPGGLSLGLGFQIAL